MRKDRIVNVPLFNNPPEPDYVIQERARKFDEKNRIAGIFGVNFLLLDGGVSEESFLTKDEREVYFRDCLLLGTLLDNDEPIPRDLIVRLLYVKDKREQANKKKRKV